MIEVESMREKVYHLFFEIGVVLKAIATVIEIVAGAFLLVASPATVNGIIHLFGNVYGLTPGRQAFWAFIALSHGIVKLALVLGLLRRKLWAYPAAAAVFALFVVYQTYDMAFRPSVPLALVTAFDIVLIILILHEYRHGRRTRAALD